MRKRKIVTQSDAIYWKMLDILRQLELMYNLSSKLPKAKRQYLRKKAKEIWVT
jgi:hypothetical protein